MAYIRVNRHTRELLDRNPAFTVNIPIHGFDKKAFMIYGTKSGRDMSKIREVGLTLADPEAVSVPAIRDFPLTLECKVIYRQEQDASQLPEAIRKQFYSVNSGDHISCYGEIMDACVIEEEE